jgi:hypothetical protein
LARSKGGQPNAKGAKAEQPRSAKEPFKKGVPFAFLAKPLRPLRSAVRFPAQLALTIFSMLVPPGAPIGSPQVMA